MDSRRRFVSAIGDARFVSLLGVLELTMAVARIGIEADGGFAGFAAIDLLIVVPALVLVYGGYWLPTTNLHRDVHSLIVARTLTGIGVMLGVVAVLALSTGLNRPVFTPMAGAALGSVAGFGIGLNEARAVSRAREAERHRDELRRERDLRDRIFETSPIGIAVIDPDGSVRMVNERAARITGRSEARLEGANHYDEPLFRASDEREPAEGELVREILRTGESKYDLERRINRADGAEIWLSVNAAPLLDASGEVTGVIVAFEDVTDRKRLEGELKETIDRLEESNDRLEQFAYAASHDLQEPLRMVSSYLQLLERRYADELDEDAREFIDFAVDGADRMRAMIDSLLAYSRVTRGDPLEPTDVDAVLEDVLADLQLRIEETGATVTTDDLPTVLADADQLAEVFRNLLSNAITYSGDGPPRIHVGAEQTGDAWRFSVADNGIGIEPEYHRRIFEVFERLHADSDPDPDPDPNGDRTEGGAGGIGLAVCERIVERHGGEIWVESEPGEGSTFYFTVPVAEERDREPSHGSARGDRPRDSER